MSTIKEIQTPMQVPVRYEQTMSLTYETTDKQVFKDKERAAVHQHYLDTFKPRVLAMMVGDEHVVAMFWVDDTSKRALEAELPASDRYGSIRIGHVATIYKKDANEIVRRPEDGWHYLCIQYQLDAEDYRYIRSTSSLMERINAEISNVHTEIARLHGLEAKIKAEEAK